MITPNRGELEEQRHRGVAILPDILYREIRGHIGIGQCSKRKADKEKLQNGNWARHRHEAAIIHLCAPERHHRLNECQGQGQHQHIVTQLNDHCDTPVFLAFCYSLRCLQTFVFMICNVSHIPRLVWPALVGCNTVFLALPVSLLF